MADNGRSFFSKQSLQGYGGATLAVTLLANFFNVLHFAIASRDPSDGVMVAVGAALSIAVVAIYAKREEGVTMPQHGFVMLLNAILLFNTNAGVNAVLHDLGKDESKAGIAVNTTEHAGIAQAIKGLFIPRTPWISADIPKVVDLQEDLLAIEESLAQVAPPDTLQARLNELAALQQQSTRAVDSLATEIVKVRGQYQSVLIEREQQAASLRDQLGQLEQAVRGDPSVGAAVDRIATFRNNVVLQQQGQQAQQQALQQEIGQQRQLQLEQQEQLQRQQLQQEALQRMIQEEQQQVVQAKRRLFDRADRN